MFSPRDWETAPARTLIAGPPVVRQGRPRERRRRQDHPFDLLPGLVAHVAQVDLVRPRPEGPAERVPETVSDDPPVVPVAAGGQGVARRANSRGGVDPDERAVQPGRVPARANVLRAEHATLGRRNLGHRGAVGVWCEEACRVAARVHARHRVHRRRSRAAQLAVVGRVEVGAVAGAQVELAVGPERETAARVARKLLAPVVQEERPRARHCDIRGRVDIDALEVRRHRAAVDRPAGRVGAGVVPDGRHLSGRGVVDEVEVQVVVPGGEERRVEGDAEQAPVPVVADLRGQVDDGRRRRVADRVEGLDDAALLRDERPAVGGEPDAHGLGQAAERGELAEVGVRERARGVDLGGRGQAGDRPTQHGGGREQRGGEYQGPPSPSTPAVRSIHGDAQGSGESRACQQVPTGSGAGSHRVVAVVWTDVSVSAPGRYAPRR